MPDYSELLNTIKQAATEAVDASKPAQVCYGKVTSASPLQILVDQKMTLGSAQLVLTRNVTDFTVSVSIDWKTESALTTHSHGVQGTDSGGDTIDLTSKTTNLKHTHDVEGTKSMTIHNALKKGDEVVLVRMQGGQQYIVIDRIGGGK